MLTVSHDDIAILLTIFICAPRHEVSLLRCFALLSLPFHFYFVCVLHVRFT